MGYVGVDRGVYHVHYGLRRSEEHRREHGLDYVQDKGGGQEGALIGQGG